MATKATTTKTTETSAKTSASASKTAAPRAAASAVKTKAKTAATAAKTTAKAASEAIKKTATRKTSARKKTPDATVVFQYGDKQIVAKELLAEATESFRAAHEDVEIKDIRLYIKAEDNCAYIVVNGTEYPDDKISF